MSENKLLDLSFEFAVAIVQLIDRVHMPKSSYMTDQLARAGTSVGANIHEAQYAQSKKDFVSKLIIHGNFLFLLIIILLFFCLIDAPIFFKASKW